MLLGRCRWVVMLLVGCTSKSTPPALEAAPKTNGIEGHGGVALAPVERVPRPTRERAEAPPPTTATSPDESVLDVEELFQRAYALKDSSPEEAERLFELVVKNSPVESPYHQRAVNRLESLRH